jgi:hypothetical protein
MPVLKPEKLTNPAPGMFILLLPLVPVFDKLEVLLEFEEVVLEELLEPLSELLELFEFTELTISYPLLTSHVS